MNSLGKAYLFTPGNSEKKMLKALNINSEAIIIDLEDAVVSREKDKARQLIYSVLNDQKLDIKTKIYVRINSIKSPWFFDDMNLINRLPQLDGIMIPKSEDRTSITLAAEILNRNIEIIPLIESARGVVQHRGYSM